MFALLKSECKYNYFFVLGIGVLAVLIALNTIFEPLEDIPVGVLAFNFPFIAIVNWMALRTKNKRERQFAPLPASSRERGMSRALIWLSLTVIWVSLYYGLVALFAPGHHGPGVMIASGLLNILVAAYMVGRDLFLGFLRDNPVYALTPERSKNLIMGLVLVLNMAGFITLMNAEHVGSRVDAFFELVLNHWLMTTWRGAAAMSLAALTMSVLSVISYSAKPGYLE